MFWSKEFWKGLGERAIKSFAQALAASLVGGGIGFLALDGWGDALSLALMTALASVLTSIGSVEFVAGKVQDAQKVIEVGAGAVPTVVVNTVPAAPAIEASPADLSTEDDDLEDVVEPDVLEEDDSHDGLVTEGNLETK